MRVPFVTFKPMEKELDKELRGAFERVFENSWYIEGEENQKFEEEFAAYCGVKHCIGCGNGLDALFLILKAYGIGEGDHSFQYLYRNSAGGQQDRCEACAGGTSSVNL